MTDSLRQRRPIADPPACVVPVGLSIALGVWLRFLFLGRKPLWEDEGWTLYVSGSPRGLLELVGLDPHPLSFYVLARWLDPLLVAADWALRLPSVCFSCIALLLWASCLRRLGMDGRVVRWCVLLFAVLPLNIRYAQEGRAYALAQFTSLLAMWAYAWTRERRAGVRLAALGAAVGLSCHVDGFGLVIPLGLLLHSVWSARADRAWRPVLFAVLGGGLLAAPYYLFRLGYMLRAGDMHTLPPVTESALSLLIERFVAATPFGMTRSALDRLGHAGVWLGVLAVVAGAMVLASSATPRRWAGREGHRLFTLCFLPALSIFFVLCAVTGADTLEQRYFVTLAPGIVPLITLGGLRLGRRVPFAGYALFLASPLAVSLLWLVQPTARSPSDWRTMYSRIEARIEPGDLFVSERFQNYPLHAMSPLRAYARRDGKPIIDDQCYEYRSAVATPHTAIDVGEPGDWPSAEEPRQLIALMRRSPSGRVWAFSGPLARHRELKLEPVATCAGRWKASALDAALWIVSPHAAGPGGIAPDAGRGTSDRPPP